MKSNRFERLELHCAEICLRFLILSDTWMANQQVAYEVKKQRAVFFIATKSQPVISRGK